MASLGTSSCTFSEANSLQVLKQLSALNIQCFPGVALSFLGDGSFTPCWVVRLPIKTSLRQIEDSYWQSRAYTDEIKKTFRIDAYYNAVQFVREELYHDAPRISISARSRISLKNMYMCHIIEGQSDEDSVRYYDIAAFVLENLPNSACEVHICHLLCNYYKFYS